MPTTPIIIYNCARLEPYMNPHEAHMIPVTMKAAALNAPRGTVLGQVTATSKYTAYLDGAGDGSNVARGILAYDIQVDASGNITLSSTATQAGGDLQQTRIDIPMYVSGTFLTSELVGLDAAAVVDLGGVLLHGTVSNGILRIG